jgi:hypothetical protein
MNPPAGPELHDIHLPPPPGWWPPAPGWWLVAAIAAFCIFLALYKLRQMLARGRFRRAVLGELDRCIAAAGSDGAALAAALSLFLRRMTLRDAPAAAALHGEHWLAHLDRGVAAEDFSRGVGKVLLDAPYRRVADYDNAALIALVRRWTRQALEGRRA